MKSYQLIAVMALATLLGGCRDFNFLSHNTTAATPNGAPSPAQEAEIKALRQELEAQRAEVRAQRAEVEALRKQLAEERASKPSPPTESATNDQPTSRSRWADPIGVWKGEWSSPRGVNYTNVMVLRRSGSDGGVEGFIKWSLGGGWKRYRSEAIGCRAVEYVRGTYEDGRLTLEGVRKKDPLEIIGMDKYRLSVTSNSIDGSTWDYGTWMGEFSSSRLSNNHPDATDVLTAADLRTHPSSDDSGRSRLEAPRIVPFGSL